MNCITQRWGVAKKRRCTGDPLGRPLRIGLSPQRDQRRVEIIQRVVCPCGIDAAQM
jgi:hypothetical protein